MRCRVSMWWAYIRGGGLIFGGAYSRRFTVVHSMQIFNDSHYSNLYAGLLA
jgi:hypothetical protein